MGHLSNQDINGYIHYTLSDAQRESMTRHLDHCPVCRERVAIHERQQQALYYDITAELRQLRSPDSMSFAAIQPGLNRSRQLASVRYVSGKALTGIGAVTVMALVAFALMFAYQWATNRPTTSPPPPQVMASTLFPYAWEEQTPFTGGLIQAEQPALDLINTAPVYHLDLEFDADLPEAYGEQEVRYVNNTERPLSALYFRLLPNMDAGDIVVTKATVNGQVVEPVLETGTTLRVPLQETLMPHEPVVVGLEYILQLERHDDNALMLSHFQPTLALFGEEEWRFDRPIYGMDAAPERSFFLYSVTVPRNQALVSNGRLLDQGLEWRDGMFQMRHTFAAGPTNQLFMLVGENVTPIFETVQGETRVAAYELEAASTPQVHVTYTHTLAAMNTYRQLFGAYPFTELALVFTPTVDETKVLPGVLIFADDDEEETAVIRHTAEALAQQWFGRIVGEHTLLEPWLAYAPSQYAARYYLVSQEILTENELRQIWTSRQGPAEALGQTKALIGKSAYEFTGQTFTETMQGKGPLFMSALSHAVGETTMRQFLHDYYQTYKWNTPAGESFQQLAEETCHCTLAPLFENWVTGKQAKPTKATGYE